LTKQLRNNGAKVVTEICSFASSREAHIPPPTTPHPTILNEMKGFGAFFSFAFAAVAAASNVIELTPKNFDEVVLKSGKPALVEFFAVSSPVCFL
jgi:malate/lactate dehydrogenase